VLKKPDSSFSAGVEKAKDEAELAQHLEAFFEKSELVVAQEFARSSFDWRIGVLDKKPLFVCRYHMARGHWQIQKAQEGKESRYGRVETLPIEAAPPGAVELGVRAASLIGTGLYGVDIKEVDGRFIVIEINDNPNIESGYEDTFLKDELYTRIMQSFLERLESRGNR
jgi:glutathione synthase/RimK-type ligase-like ATP-grasp enzyme